MTIETIKFTKEDFARNESFSWKELETIFEELLNEVEDEIYLMDEYYEAGKALRLIDDCSFNLQCGNWVGQFYVFHEGRYYLEEELNTKKGVSNA